MKGTDAINQVNNKFTHTKISGTVFESHMKCSTILVTHSINKHIMHAEIVWKSMDNVWKTNYGDNNNNNNNRQSQ